MAQFRLILRAGPAAGRAYPLEGDEITLGREPSNQIAIDEDEVSRNHARIVRKEPGYVLDDLGSTNGTFVNGQRISTPVLLKAGDLVMLGEKVKLKVEVDSDPNATVVVPKTAKPIPPATPISNEPKSIPVYSGQVPVGPAEEGINPRTITTMVWILLAMIVLGWIFLMGIVVITSLHPIWCNLPFIRSWWPGQCP